MSLKMIFTWWNRQTFGTYLKTLIFGKFVGSDQYDNKYYHMLASKYHSLSKPHSALATGHFEKITELPQKIFIENATTDLRNLIDEVKHNFGTLEDFFE